MYKNTELLEDCRLIEPLYVFTTAFASATLRKHLINLGVNHMYEKPINSDLLEKLIVLCN